MRPLLRSEQGQRGGRVPLSYEAASGEASGLSLQSTLSLTATWEGGPPGGGPAPPVSETADQEG